MIKDLIILYIFMFLSLFAIDSVYATKVLPLNPTHYPRIELLGELAEGEVLIYRIVDKVEGLTIICYPMIGHLHGKTVSNFCIYKPSMKWRTR